MGILPLMGRTLEVLSREEIRQVHRSVMEVLRETGVQIDHDEALAVFESAGADVVASKRSVHISERLVEHALNHAPRFMTVCGRDPRHDLKSAAGVHYTGGHAASMVFDPETGERRAATKKDLEDYTILHDALENSHIIFPQVYPQDVPEKALDRHISQTLLNHTEKPVIATAFTGAAARDLLNMGIAIAGSPEALRKRPMFTVSHGMISPFTFEPKRVDVLFEMCRFGLPFQLYTIPASGTTAPVTLAGTLVVMVAELLSGLVLTQLINPGTPVRLLGYAGVSDMRSGDFTFSAPEVALMAGALAQMLQFYGVPHGVHGSTTRANVLDAQAGYETGMLNLFAALSGADVIAECTSASLENTFIATPEQAIIGNEICSFINRMLKGIEVSPDTLALPVIKELGFKGEYLTHKHTMRFFKSEQWDPRLGNRLSHDKWQAKGGMDIKEKARNQAKEILSRHKPKPLPMEAQRKIQMIVDEADA